MYVGVWMVSAGVCGCLDCVLIIIVSVGAWMVSEGVCRCLDCVLIIMVSLGL